MNQAEARPAAGPPARPADLPQPQAQPGIGHLGRWARDPLGLLEEGARLGPVFGLRLWRHAIVGYSPAWNRFVLKDLVTFRSAGSLSGLTPYLGAGVVQLDAPAHAARRRALNPAFARGSVAALSGQVSEVIARRLPDGPFDGVTWSAAVVREILGVLFLGDLAPGDLAPGGTVPGGAAPGGGCPVGASPVGAFPAGAFPAGTFPPGAFPAGTFPPDAFPAGTFPPGAFPAGKAARALLGDFLRPLDRAMPAPFLRRPVLFRRMNRVLGQRLRCAPPGSLAAVFAGLADGVAEMRTAISAGYDTTAHTLAWLLAHVAQRPSLRDPGLRAAVIDEVLRLYPAGWLGSRRSAADTEFRGIPIRRGTLVLYSPYLTHRDPDLWPDPLSFRPERFAQPIPAWGHIPFAAGERTCLGRPLARLVLDRALAALDGAELRFAAGDLRPRAGLTLAPAGPLLLELRRGRQLMTGLRAPGHQATVTNGEPWRTGPT